MKQGVLSANRVRLLLTKGVSCYRPRRVGERKRKSVRGCIVAADLAVLNLVVTKKGDQDIPGLTDAPVPRRLGPKRANKVRKLFNLGKVGRVGKGYATFFIIYPSVLRDLPLFSPFHLRFTWLVIYVLFCLEILFKVAPNSYLLSPFGNASARGIIRSRYHAVSFTVSSLQPAYPGLGRCRIRPAVFSLLGYP